MWFPYLHPKPMYAFEVEMMRAAWSEPPTVFPHRRGGPAR